jgi:hypothetical protein
LKRICTLEGEVTFVFTKSGLFFGLSLNALVTLFCAVLADIAAPGTGQRVTVTGYWSEAMKLGFNVHGLEVLRAPAGLPLGGGGPGFAVVGADGVELRADALQHLAGG